ncbi:MAG TPA: PaaI family thioesterase [Desulfohalobiaceae bacterium]|nr:PaaI family thioesterase [Desulfohalobiaceae bacterium]
MKELSKERINFLKSDFCRGFIQFCQFQAEEIQAGSFHSSLNIKDFHRQQDGFIHAGVISTMADHTAGYSAFTLLSKEYQILTVEFKINFLRPAVGNKLICRSSVLKGGKQVIVAESYIYDIYQNQEKLVAKCTVTLIPVLGESLLKLS